MAQGAGVANVTVDANDALTSLQIRVRVRGKRRALWRVKAAASLVSFAARVLGGHVDLEADLGGDGIALTPEGLPRALSVSERYKGYHRDACVIGHDLVIRLDGVEQSDVIAYDVDAGIVTLYARNAGCNLRQVVIGEEAMDDFVVDRRKGVVTVERVAR